MVAAIEASRAAIEAGVDRAGLQQLLPPGGARNAVDCALWDLDAHRTGKEVWELAGLPPPKPLITTFTLGADDPSVMAAGASKYANARALKMKLTGELERDIARVQAVRRARPHTWLGVDANQGYDIVELDKLLVALVEADVSLLEQPLKRGREADLDGFTSPIPIAADESVLSLVDVPGLVGRFNVVNIKLDKCGGLTEGLAMAHEAKQLGLSVMVGNMVGSSLAMAPAFVLGQLCDVVDLDGPIFLAHDRTPAISYDEGLAWCSDKVWGSIHAATP
jgi:L-alanine-DL-glutamate epimerase-like enolase superfamily enzyme